MTTLVEKRMDPGAESSQPKEYHEFKLTVSEILFALRMVLAYYKLYEKRS